MAGAVVAIVAFCVMVFIAVLTAGIAGGVTISDYCKIPDEDED